MDAKKHDERAADHAENFLVVFQKFAQRTDGHAHNQKNNCETNYKANGLEHQVSLRLVVVDFGDS